MLLAAKISETGILIASLNVPIQIWYEFLNHLGHNQLH
jgi:hypothetical protein